ncbi:hypothetical protein A2U01_0032824, partial [Trifolium medium]|nr:hypothetical protein [Trifolium medium]
RHMARCAVHSTAIEMLSAICALRQVEWRVAPSSFVAKETFCDLRVAQDNVARRADGS